MVTEAKLHHGANIPPTPSFFILATGLIVTRVYTAGPPPGFVPVRTSLSCALTVEIRREGEDGEKAAERKEKGRREKHTGVWQQRLKGRG